MTVVPGYYGFPPADPGRQLASTADRERALDVLKAGFAEGRLTKDEHDERVGGVCTARTYADLAVATADLPGGQLPVAYYPPAPYPPAMPVYPRTVPAYRPVRYEPKTSSLALGSLWCGIVGIGLGVTSIPAVILGIMAFSRMQRTEETGFRAATAGVVLGCLGIIWFVLRIVIAVRTGGSG